MKIAVIGTGYVGLVTGVCLAEFGNEVACVDNDARKVDMLKAGQSPIYEQGIEALMERNVEAGRLSFTTDLALAVADAEAVFVAVGTPAGADGTPDLTQIRAVLPLVAKALSGHTLVVIKSTVPVGTTRKAAQIIAEANPRAEFDVASNPEFLREGSAIKDFIYPDRVIAGVDSAKAREVLTKLYEPICDGASTPLFFTTFESSELIKYASNSLLATKVAFINEIADICEKLGADVQEVSKGVGLDKRIGERFLQAGPGFGGSCFPKDTQGLVDIANKAGTRALITEAVIDSNERRKEAMADRIIAALEGDVRGKTIAILGLTFKAGTDDMRDSPSLAILPKLLERGAIVQVYDPQGMEEARKTFGDTLIWCDNTYAALAGAHVAAILTEWSEFKTLDLPRVKTAMRKPMLIDMRNLFEPADMIEAGFTYMSIGRSAVWVEEKEAAALRVVEKSA